MQQALKPTLLLPKIRVNITFSRRRADRPDADTRLIQLLPEAARRLLRQVCNAYTVHIPDFQQAHPVVTERTYLPCPVRRRFIRKGTQAEDSTVLFHIQSSFLRQRITGTAPIKTNTAHSPPVAELHPRS